MSWCGVTPFKAEVYWTEVVQQTFEVHDMSYSGGGGNSKGNLHHWNFQISEYLWLDVTGVALPIIMWQLQWCTDTIFQTKNVSFSHTKSIFTDIQSDCGCIKQELYFGHHRNAVFPLSCTQVRCSTNMNRNEYAWTIYGMNTPKKHVAMLLPSPLQYRISPSGSLAYFLFPLSLSKLFPH